MTLPTPSAIPGYGSDGQQYSIPCLPAQGPAVSANSVPMVPAIDAIFAAKSDIGATSTPVTATINDTAVHSVGPFTPQIGREIWLTINAPTSASGTAQLLRSTDGGTTKIGLTAGGALFGSFSFTSVSGAISNEIMGVETDTAATYYVSVTLASGAVTVRVAQ